ncbi:MAG TPA: hypothetical protein VE870_09950 [Bacteroidales bacterium]|nr:hypothetical protein [Bacteroidales bacterium]
MKKIPALIILLFAAISLMGQQQTEFPELLKAGDELSQAFEKLYNLPDSPSRDSLNNRIVQQFRTVLTSWDSFYYDWKQLKYAGIFRSGDNKVRVYTWFLESKNGQYSYYGFIQHLTGRKKKNQQVELFELHDHHTQIKNPETAANVDVSHWYGCIYYGIHAFKKRKKTWYVLFGYDFNSQYSRKKLLEVLTFDKDDNPVFGGNFVLPEKTVKRFILEYSAEVVASLRYNDRLGMIVFDHTAPPEAIFKGSYRFYAPDGSYDGFRFDNGDFVFEKDVDARNF